MTVKTTSPESVIDNICHNFKEITSNPVKFLIVNEDLTDSVKSIVKNTYDLTKSLEIPFYGQTKPVKSNGTLKKLIADRLDEEQIWQQLEIQNNFKSTEFLRLTAEILNANERNSSITFPFKFQDEEEKEEEGEDNEIDSGNDDEDQSQEIEEDNENIDSDNNDNIDDDNEESKPTKAELKSSKSNSIVDDKFFKLNELDRYLELEDKKEMRRNRGDESDDSEELVDYFDDDDEEDDQSEEDIDDENTGIKFKDFFRNPDERLDRKKLRFQEDIQDEEEDDFDENETEELKEEEFEDDNAEDNEELDNDSEDEIKENKHGKEIKSSLELKQARLMSRIESLEEELISEKPWQMKGEVSAAKRPQNSLLEEVVEFDLTTRPAPEITEVTTIKLEDIIRQRIKDKAWDDVERKIKPVETPQEFRKKLALDQEKSKQSLAQIYEQEYLKQAEITTANPLEEKPEEVPKEHEEIRKMMDHLFRQLNALSNFHYTPTMVLPDIRIVNNTPAIEMEEIAPVTTTDATLLAPEEVKSKHKGELMSKEERTDSDKKRERRKKKIKQKVKQKKREEREKMTESLKPGIGKKFNKDKMKKTLDSVTKNQNVNKMVDSSDSKSLKSSTSFFNKLQDEVKATIKRKTSGETKKKTELSAKKLKL